MSGPYAVLHVLLPLVVAALGTLAPLQPPPQPAPGPQTAQQQQQPPAQATPNVQTAQQQPPAQATLPQPNVASQPRQAPASVPNVVSRAPDARPQLTPGAQPSPSVTNPPQLSDVPPTAVSSVLGQVLAGAFVLVASAVLLLRRRSTAAPRFAPAAAPHELPQQQPQQHVRTPTLAARPVVGPGGTTELRTPGRARSVAIRVVAHHAVGAVTLKRAAAEGGRR